MSLENTENQFNRVTWFQNELDWIVNPFRNGDCDLDCQFLIELDWINI